jgi:hypothetical protein
MTIRTTRTTVSFSQPFKLKGRWARTNIPEAGWSLYRREIEYRIKSEQEAHERVTVEPELRLVQVAKLDCSS